MDNVERVSVMSIELLTQLISNLGFPIACVIAMFYMWNKERDTHKQEMDAQREELAELSKVIEANTLAVQSLVNRLDYGMNQQGAHEK